MLKGIIPVCTTLPAVFLITARLVSGSLAFAEILGPDPASNLDLAAPITRWDEAIPLGNGLLGGLLWGEGALLRLSLDRGDLWDLRRPEIVTQPDWNYATIRRLVNEGNQAEISKRFDAPYNDIPYPTKLPAGRLEISMVGSGEAKRFFLDLKQGLGGVEFENALVTVFFHAREPLAMLRTQGKVGPCTILASAAVGQLGYPVAQIQEDGEYLWSLQDTPSGFQYAIVARILPREKGAEIALTVTSSKDGPDPVTRGRQRVDRALTAGFDALFASHKDWWDQFWSQSGIRLPDPNIQRQYDLVQYFYGAASRRGAPPIPLQGVWTADEGTLPPWKGDYHHDLNTQLTYWAYLAAGHFEEGRAFLDFMWDLLPEHRAFAQDFFGTPGAAIPGVMTLDGKALGGWSQYSLSPMNGAWVAQAFYWHWRYTADDAFLKERAYPYLAALGECFEALLQPDHTGRLHLPLSSSPEIHDNRLEAWLTPDSNFDLALLRWHFGALSEMAQTLGETAEAQRWRAVLSKLSGLAFEPDTRALRIASDESLQESHRHHSHMMAIHPLGLLTVEGSDQQRAIIDASLAQSDQLGTRNWCGYSFSWMACMAARANKPDAALRNLEIFVNTFISRNGFHLNGDQGGGLHSNFTYRPFTLEGNFAAGQAVHEMLLQSWGGLIRIFPATPQAWQDVSFQRLRAEGGFIVSAERRAGRTQRIEIRATRDAALHLRDPFEGSTATWNLPGLLKIENCWSCKLGAGEALIGNAVLK